MGGMPATITVQSEQVSEGPACNGRGAVTLERGWNTRRRLSDVATRALAHFTARAERAAAGRGAAGEDLASDAAAVALEDLLLWLSSYR